MSLPFYMALYNAEDVEDAERDLAALIEAHAEETDPEWRDMLADQIKSDAEFLVEMRDAVFPALRLVLPLGMPAPGPVWGAGR